MARLTKIKVFERLTELEVDFGEETNYNVLCRMLKEATIDLSEEEPEPKIIKLESRIAKRNTFLADAVRDKRDADVLNNEIGSIIAGGVKRKYKGKIAKVTTIKHWGVTDKGDFLTEFIIELKD